MGGLSTAIKAEQWELVAYYLLVSVARLASQVPPESLADLLGFLAEGDDAPSA
ncbi:MAG: hypothetical protein IIC27_03305 [Chloroflexi bacterium]|nr:hypothetical protein [Chloroflexota bacterium]